MTAPLALAQARHEQALSALADAEQELLTIMASIAPVPAIGIIDGLLPRRFEALIEGPRPYWELSQAYSAFRRALNAESKAKSAAHRARWTEMAAAPPAPPAPRRRKKLPKRMTIGDYLEARAA